jgi:hypothetical protein
MDASSSDKNVADISAFDAVSDSPADIVRSLEDLAGIVFQPALQSTYEQSLQGPVHSLVVP